MQQNPLRQCEDARVDAIYSVLKGRISLDNLIPTCIEVAREVEGLTGLKGPQKLEVLQNVLRMAVRDSRKSDEEKESIRRVIDTVIPIAIQAAILASKSPIVAQVQSACVGCWTKTKRS
jgi:hypothetical protein